MKDFHCESCGVELSADEVMCDSCGEDFLTESGPDIFVDGAKLSKTSQAYANTLDAILGRMMR